MSIPRVLFFYGQCLFVHFSEGTQMNSSEFDDDIEQFNANAKNARHEHKRQEHKNVFGALK